jgi:microcystin-dependent protein
MDPYLAEIRIFSGTFEPLGWKFCQGQSLPIASYDALFTLLGTSFGGDGVTTFNLPDLRGRVPVHPGQGPGLTGINEGEMGGSETQSLTLQSMPTHNHGAVVTMSTASITMKVSTDPPSQGTATAGASLCVRGGTSTNLVNTFKVVEPDTAMNTASVSSVNVSNSVAGSSQPHENMQPWIAMNYMIAVEGIYPSQS